MSAGRTPAAAALALLLAAAAPAGAADGAAAKPGGASRRLEALGNEYLARHLERFPHLATRLGDHTRDDRLLPAVVVSPADEAAWQRAFRSRLATVPRQLLDPGHAAEHDLLLAAVERELLELEVVRSRERDPGAWLPLVAGAIGAVLERRDVSACTRVRLAARRLAQVPEVLRAARLALATPARAETEAAIADLAGVLRFYRESVPVLAAPCRTAPLQADLAQADTAAVRAVEAFRVYLQEDLLPAAGAGIALGPDACRRWLRIALLEEPAPVESLLARAGREVEARRAELERRAAAVAPGGVREALDSLAAVGVGAPPGSADLEPALAEVIAFLRQRELVTLPARIGLRARAAPPYRPLAEGPALQAPGPWEPPGVPAWLEVAADPPPAPSVPGAPAGRPDLALAVARAGLPGAYLRAVALRGAPSRRRSALQSAWPGEDWSGYGETMLVEEGFADDPRGRLVAAHRALLRAGRSYAALGFHAGVFSLEQARTLLEDRCLLDPARAAREAQRVAAEPALMGYTFGERGLLDLRDEARRSLGPRFRIRDFNDAVLRAGASPLGLVREAVRRELGIGAVPTPEGATSEP